MRHSGQPNVIIRNKIKYKHAYDQKFSNIRDSRVAVNEIMVNINIECLYRSY